MIKNISEADTRANYIDPKLIESDWASDNIESGGLAAECANCPERDQIIQ